MIFKVKSWIYVPAGSQYKSHQRWYKTQYKHFFQHPQNPEITASKGSQRVLRPRSARYHPSRLPWVQGGHPRAREPTFRIFTVANLGYTQKYRRSIVILSQ